MSGHTDSMDVFNHFARFQVGRITVTCGIINHKLTDRMCKPSPEFHLTPFFYPHKVCYQNLFYGV
ncbi:MAG: hypothetical protein Ct9H300mP28_25600 [Pseudomonadota bacterium]|nr:MAG: hypothetical protein Ct9H300mP28_25600 [Pseudomonadota bacterium]